jgi:hypothetical protein
VILTASLLLLLFVFFISIGLWFYRIFQCTDWLKADGALNAFWAGWALVVAGLQLWHLAFPVNEYAQAVFGLAAVFSATLAWPALRQLARDHTNRAQVVIPAAGATLLLALILSNHVMFIPAHYDHGLYHLQGVKWISNFAIVPGLGNLHHRFAFNNANLLLAALLNRGMLYGYSYYLSNTLLALALITRCCVSVLHVIRNQTHTKTDLYYAFLLAPALWQVSTTHLAGYSPDFPVFALGAVGAGELLRLLEMDAGDQRGTQFQACFLALLMAAGITVKMSFAAYGGLALLATAVFLWFKNRAALPKAVGWGALLVAPWLARNVILSGYLLFPSTFLSLPVKWKMPSYLADPVSSIISNWAYTRSDSIPYTADWEWFTRWLKPFVFEVKQTFVIALVLIALSLILFALKRQWKALDWRIGLLFLISSLSLVFWFASAPDYRFSGAAFWVFFSAALLLFYDALTLSGAVHNRQGLVVIMLLAAFFVLSPNQFSKNISRKLLLMPVPEPQLAEEERSLAEIQTKTTASGLTVNMPPGDGADCWDYPLPCVPFGDYLPTLRLIEPGNLAKGFYIP